MNIIELTSIGSVAPVNVREVVRECGCAKKFLGYTERYSSDLVACIARFILGLCLCLADLNIKAHVRLALVHAFLACVCILSGCSARSFDSLDRAVTPRNLDPQEWIALGRPGPDHQVLDLFVGDWNVKISARGSSSDAPITSEGESHFASILGGRFLEERFKGELAGQPYEGRGYLGFDNATKRYSSTWFESLVTAPTLSYGIYDPTARRFQFVARVYDPLLGRLKESKSVLTVYSEDAFSLSMLERDAQGNEFSSFELTYHRR